MIKELHVLLPPIDLPGNTHIITSTSVFFLTINIAFLSCFINITTTTSRRMGIQSPKVITNQLYVETTGPNAFILS